MTEFPVDVLWAIKSMTLRSIWNPNAIKYTLEMALYTYLKIFFLIFAWVIVIFLIKFWYKFFKKIKENKEKKLIKKYIKEVFDEEKYTFKILKYPLIWIILVRTWWAQISLLFRLFSGYYKIQWDIIRETLPLQESWVLWLWATYSLSIFIIAWYFIWLSFGNKMLRNIWILIYALWILFILFGSFLDYWSVINDLPNFTV